MNSGYVTIYGEKKIKWSICSCLLIWDIRGKCCYTYHFLKPCGNGLFTLKEIAILCGFAGCFRGNISKKIA